MSTGRLKMGATIALVLSAAACATSTPESDGDPFDGAAGSNAVLLSVQNNDFRDATVHVYWNGVRTRAGMVTGKTSETFRMPWRSEWAYLEIDFIGGGGFTSERIGVNPGDHLDFVILPGM